MKIERINSGDEVPTLDLVPLSTFLTSPTAFSSSYRVSLFHPTTASRIHTPGGFPVLQSNVLIERRSLRAVSNTSTTSKQVPKRRKYDARLQGVNPKHCPSQHEGGLALHTARSPLAFSVPHGPILKPPGKCLHTFSTYDLKSTKLDVLHAPGPGRINR